MKDLLKRGKEEEIIIKGILPCGLDFVIVRSEKSAVTFGDHFILNILKENGEIASHSELSPKQKGEAHAILEEFILQKETGRYWIAVNGPDLTSRSTCHFHGVISKAPGQVLRFVCNVKSFVDNMKSAETLTVMRQIVDDFEKNLK